MLSNPPNMPASRSPYRQHRRQNSTPSAFDAVKIAPLPNLQQRRLVAHRRGLSLDVRAPRLAPAPAPNTARQEYGRARSSTTHGGPETTPKKSMQDTQSQHAARLSTSHPTFTDHNTGDPFLMSPEAAGQGRLFAGGLTGEMPLPTDINGLPFDPFSGSLGLSADQGPQDFEFFTGDSSLSTPTFMTFPDSSPASASCQAWITETERANADSRRSSRRISNGIMDKVAKFEAMGNGPDATVQRPCTPSSQIGSDFFPQTPVEGSTTEEAAPIQPPNRFLGGYDESMEETLKPIRNKNSNRNSGIFQDLRQQAEAMARTPPRANTMPVPALNPVGLRTPDFMNMRTLSAEFREIEREFGSIPASPSDTPSMFAFIKAHNAFADKPDLQPVPGFDSQQTVVPMDGAPSPGSQTPSRRGSPHRRTESIASMTSAASIADINIEETKTETGVTMDEIAAFIQGPDPTDGKWRCIYEGCNKTFGRKENIKSHVQTHLNDRQYQCPTCKKCFVRQHDLKRHAKIHTGIKPYPCECGNSFARHDALTRHRQRGMCIGAFDGVVRKVVKRGRPKKIRPDMDERRDKAERTRRKNSKSNAGNITSAASTTSSQSGCYSDFSAANSPMDDFHDLLDDDAAAFPDILSLPHNIHPSTLAAVSTASLPPTATISGNLSEVFHSAAAVSPSDLSSYSRASSAHPNGPEPPPSPAKSVASHYTTHHHPSHPHAAGPPNTPPDLSSPSSPPALSTSSAHFFDLAPPATSHSASTTPATTATDTPFAGQEGSGGGGGSIEDLLYADAEDLLGLGDHHQMMHVQQMMQQQQQQQNQGGMLMGKFEKFDEEEFDAVSMFTNGGDVFFGTA